MNTEDPLSSQFLLLGPPGETAGVSALLEQANWTHTVVHSSSEALTRVRHGPGVDALIVSPGQPARDYLELCRALKLQSRTSHIPVVFVLAPALTDLLVQVYQAGADDCIRLPASREEVALRILKTLQVANATDSLEDATAIITALANAIEGKDSYTCGHVERVATYSLELGKAMGLDAADLATLRTGALLHDIGKVTVPDQILNKPGELTQAELEVIKRHPLVGDEILKTMRTFQAIRPIVRWHHERPNGTGYPDGIGGNDLPVLPRIVTVADCFDALNSDRPYRATLPLDRCQAILEECAVKGDLDPDIVRLLISFLGREAAALQLSTAGS
jgi:putative two-component system response regulator